MRGSDSILEYFLLGIIFCSVVVPLLEGLTSMLLQGIEVINGFFKVVITKQTLKIAQLSDEINEPKSKTKKIGFAYDEGEDDE